MKTVLLFLFSFLLFSSDSFASVTAEEAYDMVRKELFSTDQKAEHWYIVRNETPWNFYEDGLGHKPYEFIQIENKLKGKEYWAVTFGIGEIGFYFFVDSTNGKIIASYPSHEEILKYYSRGKGIISMDAAIAIADKEILKRNINLKQMALKINKKTLGYVYENYSAIRPKISKYWPREKEYRKIWEITYRIRGESKERNIVVLIDAVSGELLDYMEKLSSSPTG